MADKNCSVHCNADAAFRHFGDKHVWMTGVGPILEKMDGSDDSFEAALQELCTYMMCGPDGKTGVDAVDLYTLSDGQLPSASKSNLPSSPF